MALHQSRSPLLRLPLRYLDPQFHQPHLRPRSPHQCLLPPQLRLRDRLTLDGFLERGHLFRHHESGLQYPLLGLGG